MLVGTRESGVHQKSPRALHAFKRKRLHGCNDMEKNVMAKIQNTKMKMRLENLGTIATLHAALAEEKRSSQVDQGIGKQRNNFNTEI